MKEGWEVKKLGEVCEVLNGFAFKSDKYVEDGVRVIRITNVQHGYIEDNDPKFYPIDECERLNQYMLKEQDLLMSLTGNVGRVGLLDNKFLPAALNQRVACLRVKDKSVELKYLFHHLNSELFETRCIQSAKGIAQKNMSTEWLKEYSIPIPPLPEQSRIVEEFDLLSNIIEKKRQQLSELDNLAQSIFYDMFGDPVENEKGWKTLFLEKLISTGIITYHLDGNHGSDYPRREEFVENGIIYIGANCIENGLINFKLAKYLTEEKVKTLRKGIAKNNDVLFAHNASVGPVAHLRTTEEVIILSTSLTAFRCNELFMNPLFLRAYMCSEWFVPQYQKLMKQTTRNQIPITQQRRMLFINPPVDLQNKFASKIEAIEKQKELIKQSIAETEELFNSRMDYYFS